MIDEIASRTVALIGEEAYKRLKRSFVVVAGLGGVGGYVSEALARAGTGRLLLVDSDRIAPSNLNRQILARSDNIGVLKTEAAKQRIESIAPYCRVETVNEFILPDNISALMPSGADAIADCIDTVSAKIGLAKYAEEKGIYIVSSMGTGNKTDPFLFRLADIYETQGCPLARVMRRELKKLGVKGLKTVYSPEIPPEGEKKERIPASISYMPGIAGLMIAGEIIRHICRCSEN